MGTALTGNSAGGFWHRLGEMEGATLDCLSLLGGTATTNVASGAQLPTRLTAWVTDLTAGNADYPTITTLQQAVSSQQASALSIVQAIATAVPQLLINMADLDTPLQSLSSTAALQLLQNEMVAASAYINHGTVPAVGAQTAAVAAAPVGNPTLVWSTVDSAGRALQYLVPDVITTTITSDAQNGATAGSEPFTLTGQNAQSNTLSWDWFTSKYGSGASSSGTLTDPAIVPTSATATGNLTANGVFANFTTSNQADNWTYVVGTAGTNFLNSTSTTNYFSNGGSLEMLSAGGTLNDMGMSFNTASSTLVGVGGTPYALVPSAVNNAQYAISVPIKMKTASPTNGTLTIDLVDGSGTVIADDSGTNNSVAISLTAIADTNWHIESVVFRMPQALPVSTPYKLRFRFTGTILDVTNAVYIGGVGMAAMTQLSAGNVYFAAFRGSTNPNSSGAFPDSWTNALTYTPGKFQKAIFRYFNPPSLGPQTPGLTIPAITSGSATIADSLVS